MNRIERLRLALQDRMQGAANNIRDASLKNAPDVADEELHQIYFMVDDELDSVECEINQNKTPGQIISQEIADRGLIVPLMVGLPLVLGIIIGGVLGLTV